MRLNEKTSKINPIMIPPADKYNKIKRINRSRSNNIMHAKAFRDSLSNKQYQTEIENTRLLKGKLMNVNMSGFKDQKRQAKIVKLLFYEF